MLRQATPGRTSLIRLNARLLALVLIVFEALIVAAVMVFLMLPMARRSADDLAGLMLLSAQTWSELPPQTRASFEEELIQTHWLSLREEMPAHESEHWHGIYLHFLEQAVSAKTGVMEHFVHETIGDETWFWARLPSGGGSIAVGMPAKRVGTHPFMALIVTFLAGLVLAIIAANWLARRISQPLKQLESAVAEVGKGNVPTLLPEQWPLEIAELAERVNQMASQVRDLLGARTTLLAGVSHDLRTPLARMRLALALLADTPEPLQIRRLERDIEAMDQLIGNILDLARGLEKEPFQTIFLEELLAEVVRLAGSEQVFLKIEPNIGEVALPPIALRRVVANLLGNALRHDPDGTIQLIAEQTAAGLQIVVLDRGPGIPADQLELVFQPFHRIDASRSSVTGGSGLGLAIVRQLTDIYGWQVKLRNRQGGGLAASILIPASNGS